MLQVHPKPWTALTQRTGCTRTTYRYLHTQPAPYPPTQVRTLLLACACCWDTWCIARPRPIAQHAAVAEALEACCTMLALGASSSRPPPAADPAAARCSLAARSALRA